MRNLDPAMQAALTAGVLVPAFLAELTFKSGTQRVWTGYGPLSWNANTFAGVGALAGIGAITEGIAVRADGTSVYLCGVDPTLYAESVSDVQPGAPAKLWFCLFYQGTIIGAPYLLFSGLVDKPTVNTGTDSITIELALENRMTNLQRPSARRYTQADQLIKYTDDCSMGWVESLNDRADMWGS